MEYLILKINFYFFGVFSFFIDLFIHFCNASTSSVI